MIALHAICCGERGAGEIDKSDGMLLLFCSAVDAVGYALAYHRAIGALECR
jgi:hypothetical protein